MPRDFRLTRSDRHPQIDPLADDLFEQVMKMPPPRSQEKVRLARLADVHDDPKALPHFAGLRDGELLDEQLSGPRMLTTAAALALGVWIILTICLLLWWAGVGMSHRLQIEREAMEAYVHG